MVSRGTSALWSISVAWVRNHPRYKPIRYWHDVRTCAPTDFLPLKGLLIVVIREDVVWCISASWICASIWSLKPKPFPVFVSTLSTIFPVSSSISNAPQITVVIFTLIHPLALVASSLYFRLRGRSRQGAIALPPDDEHGPRENGTQRPPREVDAEALWG